LSTDHDILRALVEFADTFVADYDVVDFLQRLAERCITLLDVDEAGVMLVDANQTLRYAASSSEKMRLVELLELQTNEGPCLDAFNSRAVIASNDADDAERRWPTFGPHGRAAGFETYVGIPLRLRAESIGALNLLSRQAGGLSDDDAFVAQALADIATIGVLQARAIEDGRTVTTQLQTALESRIAIEQAKGILAERMTMDVEAAFELLRGHARTHNAKLTDIARAIVDGTVTPEDLNVRTRAHGR
jgi:transcriptional regulator with GAF, ATPase, and Fis domain